MVKAKSRVSGVVMTGPLAPFRDAYRMELSTRGYTARSVVPQLRQVGRLSQWLQGRGLTAAQLDEGQVEEFLVAQRAEGRHRSQWSRFGVAVPAGRAPEAGRGASLYAIARGVRD